MRRSLILGLVMLLATAPLLACLPTRGMSEAEMACCKKMAGNCDMGTGNHGCCKTTVSTPQLTAITHNVPIHQQDALVTLSPVLTNDDTGLTGEIVRVVSFSFPISPPGSSTILRI
ncbi:MAG: hypothetical protein JSS69_12845 [Acidobacteria bacterium]|nr:hypothetical protein [Acidobacteriota bacterium]MBS1866794.1 hypothetical protein [Acidobacteriota bacterium]